VKEKASGYGDVLEPGRRLAPAVEMDLTLLMGKKMRVALELERRAPADYQWESQEALKRYDDLFPLELATRAAVDPSSGLDQPAMGDVLRAELAVVAALLEPGSVDEKAFGEESLESVYLVSVYSIQD
jgi:hypothetical protein